MLLSVVALLSVADANDARKNANKLCQQSHWYIDGRAMPTTGDIRSKDVEFSKSWGYDPVPCATADIRVVTEVWIVTGKAPEDGSVTLVLKGTCGPRSEKYQSRISLSRYYGEDARRAFVDTGFAVVMRQIDPGFPVKLRAMQYLFPELYGKPGTRWPP